MPDNPKWLRYDPDEDKSRHAATDEECCDEMARKYRWELIDIEPLEANPFSLFKVDCVFDGKTEFPKSYYDTELEEERWGSGLFLEPINDNQAGKKDDFSTANL